LVKLYPMLKIITRFLRCLTRELQPKVSAIKKSQIVNTLDLATLFGQLEEHEQERKAWLDMEKR